MAANCIGSTAISSHITSLAGDYSVCESCLIQAGAMVARSFGDFIDLYRLAQGLHSRTIAGNRLTALSTAGFEAVGMADNIHREDFDLPLASLSRQTRGRIKEALTAISLEHLVEIKNPLALTAGGIDSLHRDVVEILVADEGVDLVIVGIIPFAPLITTLNRDILDGRGHRRDARSGRYFFGQADYCGGCRRSPV